MSECFVSIATATRLAQRVGLSGFPELKFALIEAKKYDTNIKMQGESVEIKEYSKNLISAIDESFDTIIEATVKFVIKAIHNAEKVDFYAVGGTNLIAQDFAFKLDRLGKYVTYYADFHMQYVQAKKSNDKTVAIAISFSGTTPEIVKSIKIAKENNATTILITRDTFVGSPYVDYFVPIKVSANHHSNSKTISRITILALLDLVYLKLLELDPEYYNEQIKLTKFET